MMASRGAIVVCVGFLYGAASVPQHREGTCTGGRKCAQEDDEVVDVETELANEQGVYLLQTHLQLQGNGHLDVNRTNLSQSDPTNAPVDPVKQNVTKAVDARTWNAEAFKKANDAQQKQAQAKRFGKRLAYQHGPLSPVGLGDSWPSLPVIALELILGIVCLLSWAKPQWMTQRDSSSQPTPQTASINILAKAASSADDPSEKKLLHHRFVKLARENPQNLALIDGEARESFGVLQASALYVAKYLVEVRGVKPCSRTPIGVCAEGRYMMHAILGIVQTGNPYVPLPPNLPATQRDFIVEDANVTVVLTDSSATAPGGSWAGRKEASPADVLVNTLTGGWTPTWEVSETDLAYILYTSGSTGKPKGVLAPHTAYYNRLKWIWEAYPFAEGEVGMQKTAIGWIDHVQEIFGFLGGGVPLVLAPPAVRTNPVAMLNLCKQHSVSRLVLVPSLGRVIVGAYGATLANELPSLRFWLCSGEPFPKELLQALLGSAPPGSTVLNTYGTTEVAGDVTFAAYNASTALPAGDMVPIGRAIPPNQVHLLNPETLQHVPAGETGEIFIEGPHLAVGYHKRPDENKERFIELPGLGIKRAFRTGDFGKLDADNMIQYAGRKDQQVKVHGQRVEVLQVECALKEALLDTSPDGKIGISPACAIMAIPSTNDPGSYRLLAYVEPTDSKGNTCPLDVPKLKELMRRSLLPAHIPESINSIQALPKLVNGKLDRMALKKVAAEEADKKQEGAGVTEELDSFGQIRRILSEHVHGRRVIGTVNTCALFVVLLMHSTIHDDFKSIKFQWFSAGAVVVPPWATTVLLIVDCLNEVSLLMAGLGALHGMGDESKFKFSIWEPAFLVALCMIHTFENYFLPPEGYIGYLYFLPLLFLGRVWVIMWHQMLTMCGITPTSITNVLSASIVPFLALIRHADALKWVGPLSEKMRAPFPVYLASFIYIGIYAFGFYLGPVVLQKARELREKCGCLPGLCIFAVSLLGFFWMYGDEEKLDDDGADGDAKKHQQALAYTICLVRIVCTWVGFSSLPDSIDFTLPGVSALICYIGHMWWLPIYFHGCGVFGVKLFPSAPDAVLVAGRAPAPLNGIGQLLVVFFFIAGYFLLVVKSCSLAAHVGASEFWKASSPGKLKLKV